MTTIFVDDDCKCHFENDGTMTAVETDFFDGKCKAYIEGFRFVPFGKTWTRADGSVIKGEVITAWKPWYELDAAQREYERHQLASYEQALSEIEAALGVSV